MGKTSKREEAQQEFKRRVQQQREEMERQQQQNRLIRNTMLLILAAILLVAGILGGIEIYKRATREIDLINADFVTSDDTTEYVRLTVDYTDKDKKYHRGEIIVQLYPEVAPITVENFQKLVGEGFYDGLTFHRIIPGFMIQGGDPNGDGTGGTPPIKGEFSSNSVANDLQHTRGVISMARSQSKNSGSSQFFIMHEAASHLDGEYAAFGEVVSGMEAVDGIAGTKTRSDDSPVKRVKIVKAEFVKRASSEPVVGETNSAYAATTNTTELVRMTVRYTEKNKVYRQGEIVMELYPDVAPITVENFQKLVGEGFYNGLTFHRIISGFMIQGGDPKGNGTGGSTPIKGEFSANGVTNDLLHTRGVLSMARSNDMDSGSSQFFIMHADAPHLDGNYASFGKVVSGMDVVDGIAGTKVSQTAPLDPVTIVSIEFVDKIG